MWLAILFINEMHLPMKTCTDFNMYNPIKISNMVLAPYDEQGNRQNLAVAPAGGPPVDNSSSRGNGKQRLRWTLDLHDHFVDAITQLGGPDIGPRRSTNVSTQSVEVSVKNEDEPGEWMAQVEPGVQITFVSLPVGWNDLKRIRLSREACLNNGPTSKFLPLSTPPRSEDVGNIKNQCYLYSCCSRHMTGDSTLLTEFKERAGTTITFKDDSKGSRLESFSINSVKPKNSIWKKIIKTMPQKNYEEAWS
ncbi:hypothetical protein AgCh_039389 [Apium graveolens]